MKNMESVIGQKVNINLKDQDGRTSLHSAIEKRDSKIMIKLLPGRGSADLILQDARGMFALLLTV